MNTNQRLLTLSAFVAAVLIAMPQAHAGYAQAVPPAGWSAGGGAGGSFAGAANAETFSGGVRAGTVINAGGRATTMPAAMRFAANAGRFAARGFVLNPALLGAAGVAWFASKCIAYEGGQWVLTCGGEGQTPSDGFEYSVQSFTTTIGWFQTREAA